MGLPNFSAENSLFGLRSSIRSDDRSNSSDWPPPRLTRGRVLAAANGNGNGTQAPWPPWWLPPKVPIPGFYWWEWAEVVAESLPLVTLTPSQGCGVCY